MCHFSNYTLYFSTIKYNTMSPNARIGDSRLESHTTGSTYFPCWRFGGGLVQHSWKHNRVFATEMSGSLAPACSAPELHLEIAMLCSPDSRGNRFL